MAGARMSGRRGWRVALASGAGSVALGAALCLGLAACGGGGSSVVTPTQTATVVGQATAAPPGGSGGVGAGTPTLAPGSAAQAGTTDICTSPISVAASLPADVPAYAKGQLRLAQASGSAAEFGYCSTDDVTTIAGFYAKALTSNGWQNVQTFENLSTENIIATKGSGSITITVSPDIVQQGSTDLLIIIKSQ